MLTTLSLYIAVHKATATSASTTITAFTTAIYEWLLHNCLALNPDKSESALLGTATRIGPLCDVVSVNIAGTPITLSHSIKSLELVIDENLKFDSHVSAVCRVAFPHSSLAHLHPMMSTNTATMVACAIVSSRLDYCNSVLAGMSDANFKKLERVQYSLACVVTGMPVYSRDHMIPVLAKLHWLPIRARVSFKIVTTVFKIRQTGQPSYLAELIEDAVSSRTLLRSSARRQSRTVLCFGTRAFRQTAAKTWNSLSDDVRLADKLETFRSRLKTHLLDFRIASCSQFPNPRIAFCYIWRVKINVLLLLLRYLQFQLSLTHTI